MPYRNGTYIAFDGQVTADPTESDLKYLGLLQLNILTARWTLPYIMNSTEFLQQASSMMKAHRYSI